jgi:DNA-binding SARP family transcriptional activator
VLGVPRATINGTDLDLTPQQLSTLAFLALHREATTSELFEAIWHGQRVPEQRLRDLLSVLRRKTAPHAVIGKITDGKVSTDVDLGSDTMVFEALNARVRSHPAEWAIRSNEMLDLVSGPPFSYPTSAEQHWRWADLGQLHSTWQHRVTTVAVELAELYLANGDAGAALDVATHALGVDPLSSAVTETLIKAYAASGELAAAQRVFESHDRMLTDMDLGGASEETRRLFDQLRAARSDIDGDASGAPPRSAMSTSQR